MNSLQATSAVRWLSAIIAGYLAKDGLLDQGTATELVSSFLLGGAALGWAMFSRSRWGVWLAARQLNLHDERKQP